MKWSVILFAMLCLLVACVTLAADRPNILFITVDDMSCDSVGVYGCELEGTTPHMDKLASQGLWFQHAHVQVGNCKPCRNVMWSGMYPHRNGVEGFGNVKNDYPVASDLFKKGGYLTAIRGKASHSTPYHPYPAWDLNFDVEVKPHIKDVASYGESTATTIAAAKKAGKPFFMSINISDPHKPFYKGEGDKYQPTRVYKADEVPIPGFLFDHPEVRKELALYYSSVRRADDAVGAILAALDASGEADNTVVMFLSDHGMPLPFAKTQLYHHSTHTPWMVRWPGVIEPNTHDTHHMISVIDALPTLLDIAGIAHPDGFQGKSFLPVLKGRKQGGRDHVVKEYNQNAGGQRTPMRSVQTRKYMYIYNPWSNGTRNMSGATKGTATFRAMVKLAEKDRQIASRLHLFNHRVYEEFYDIENDPDALHNLIDSPEHRAEIDKHRELLLAWMVRTDDWLLDIYRQRDDRSVAEAHMLKEDAAYAERRKSKRANKKKSNKKKSK